HVRAQVNLEDGLITYNSLNGHGQDQSGNNNHLSSTGTQTFWGTDRFMNFPGSMRFIGENGQAKMTFNQSLLNNRSEWTVSFWVLISSPPSPASAGINVFGQDNLLEIGFYDNSNPRFVIYHPTGGSVSIPVSPAPTIYKVWRHILITGNSAEK